MNIQVLLRYLIDGSAVGKIADDLGLDRADVRHHLREEGINIKPALDSYPLGRDPVCDSVMRSGYNSFHHFAQVQALTAVSDQASGLGVSEKALTRVYIAYQKLLAGLKAAGVVLPTPQGIEGDLERRDGEA